jgi:hypothetical protein
MVARKAKSLPAETGLLGDHLCNQGPRVIGNLCLCKASLEHPSPDSGSPAPIVPGLTPCVHGLGSLGLSPQCPCSSLGLSLKTSLSDGWHLSSQLLRRQRLEDQGPA